MARQDIRPIKSRIEVLQVQQRADQQPGTNQQDQTQGDLGQHQRSPKPMGPATRYRAGALHQGLAYVHPSRLESRSQTKQKDRKSTRLNSSHT